MLASTLASLTVLSVALTLPLAHGNALDDYVNAPDPHFSYAYTGHALTGKNGWTGYQYNMTSQVWLNNTEDSRALWFHEVIVVIPHCVNLSRTTGLLYITGGDNRDPKKNVTFNDEGVNIVASLAINSCTAAAVLRQVPNDPIKFPWNPLGPRHALAPDAELAISWWHLLNYPNEPDFVIFLPMVKAAKKALDFMEAVMHKHTGGVKLSKFIVAGASKRGWTTWLHGAVDKRIIAIIPLVLDALNLRKFLERQWRFYGGWTFALGPFYDYNCTATFDDPNFVKFEQLIDPYQYRDRLTMPKLAINAVGDEFQMPDDQRHWVKDMKGEMQTVMVKNADHTLATGVPIVVQAASAFITAVNANFSRPHITWDIDNSTGEISVNTNGWVPTVVKLVYGYSAEGISKGKRDFRWAAVNATPCDVKFWGACLRPILWTTTDKMFTSDSTGTKFKTNTLAIQPTVADKRWMGFFLEMQFANPTGANDFYFTSPTSVVPDTFAFPSCTGAACKGHLM